MNALRFGVVAVGVALVLSGCAASSPSDSTATPTVTPTPTPSAPAEPSPTLALSCADLISTDDAVALLGYPVELAPAAWQLTSISTVAAVQGGALTCQWTPPGVKPDRSADLSLSVSTHGPFSDPAIGSTCDTGSCEVALDRRWLFVRAWPTQGPNANTTVDAGAWDALVASVTSAVSAATQTNPPWTPPADTAQFEGCPSGFAPDPATLSADAAAAGLRLCAAEGRYFSVLPGGAWAMPTLTAELPEQYHKSPWVPVDVAGAGSALTRYGDGSFDVLATVDGTMIQVTRAGDASPDQGSTVEELTAEVVSELESIIAHY
ncbi:hypothetical protein M2152_001882 [Microbacteriaceae bacterium SG_E_30_P1]|uniref:Uncharacterized protein n=1 Tax=Antiquaquibacter oligotrophicus TaxID=2880260 RepID=A0ABT6KNY1_9MICO|nr:hypothetical protein [Antiquaquibacter oligotrophicus]MDH6181700.1 hypothetical protein [Antiquaquibacter oligotrophicus]UDF12616.1 hypothetical protein LH407_10690 [Antiquaquibacter oligotrophicus]